MPEIVQVKDLEQFKKLVGSSKPTVVQAEDQRCYPCTIMTPIFQDFADETPKVQFISFDVEEASDIVDELGIISVPTFFLYQAGEKKEDEFTTTDRQKIQALISNARDLIN